MSSTRSPELSLASFEDIEPFGMFELLTVLAFALLPVIGNVAGSLLAESVRTPKWVIGASLHAAAGIAIGVVSFQLMPRVIGTASVWLMVGGFLAGALVSLALAIMVRSRSQRAAGSAGAWMVWVAVCADLLSDGIMTGAGSAVASGLGLLIALSQSVANVPGGFAATANLRDDGVARKWRLTIVGILAVPVLASAGLAFWLLRGADPFVQNGALAVIAGVLLVTTVEDIVPEGDAPRPARWASTTAFAGGFALLGLATAYM